MHLAQRNSVPPGGPCPYPKIGLATSSWRNHLTARIDRGPTVGRGNLPVDGVVGVVAFREDSLWYSTRLPTPSHWRPLSPTPHSPPHPPSTRPYGNHCYCCRWCCGHWCCGGFVCACWRSRFLAHRQLTYPAPPLLHFHPPSPSRRHRRHRNSCIVSLLLLHSLRQRQGTGWYHPNGGWNCSAANCRLPLRSVRTLRLWRNSLL